MKKVLLVILTAALLLSCAAPASAAFVLPAELTAIGDEAFMNAGLPWLVTIPDGVQTIGRRAFSGSTAAFFYLPPTLSAIAPDAFDKGATFELLPDTYAQTWCRENGFDYDLMRVYISASEKTLYPGGSADVSTNFPYPERVSFYRWETSTDQRTWTTVAEGSEREYTVEYEDLAKLEGESLHVRCRAMVNGTLLQEGEVVELRCVPDKLAFTNNTRALNADSAYLEWTNMGPGTVYYLQQEVDNDWILLATLTDVTSHTVYGLEKNTQYTFAVVAFTTDKAGKQTRYQTDGGINLKTLSTGTTKVNVTRCMTHGTALDLEWDPVDGAYYDVAVGPAGGEMEYIAENWKLSNISYYVLAPNTKYEIEITARVADSSAPSGARVFRSDVWTVPTGSGDPCVELNEPVARGETVNLSWTALPGVSYAVLMSENGGEEQELATTNNTGYDVAGLERNRQYSFRVKAYLGTWSSFSDPVTVTLPARSEVEYRALLIGEGNFEGEQYAARNYGDIEMLSKLFAGAKTPTGGAYSSLCRQDLSRDGILDAIGTAFRDADDNDVSLFFIATHGDTLEIGNKAGSLSTVESNGKSGSLLLEDLAAALGKVKGTVIVWLGSCGSGAAIYDESVPQNGDAAFNAAALAAFAAQDTTVVLDETLAEEFTVGETNAFERGELRQPKFYVLTAARYHEMSWGTEARRYNFFPKYICDGAAADPGTGLMPADLNQDGKLTQHELYSFIKTQEEDPENFINQNVQEYPLNSDYVLFVS